MEDAPEPLAPGALERVRASFARQGLMTLLGAELTDVKSGTVRVRLRTRPDLTQQHGYIHAGATSAIADTAGGYAALTLLPPNSEVVTVEYKINLLAPALGDFLEATGQVLRAGRSLVVCRLDVHAHHHGTRTLVAAGQQTLAPTPPPTDSNQAAGSTGASRTNPTQPEEPR